MESYTIKNSKHYIYEIIFDVIIYIVCAWAAINYVDPTSRYAGKCVIGLYIGPLYIIAMICRFYYCSHHKDFDTLKINSKRIVISGHKSNVDLEWRKIKSIEIINGLVTRLVFHFSHNTQEVKLYGYQTTFKMVKALKYFGNGIELIERKKKFKIFYVPFW